jgi:hypothetical protein
MASQTSYMPAHVLLALPTGFCNRQVLNKHEAIHAHHGVNNAYPIGIELHLSKTFRVY